mmetsp:Transcript_71646/g.198802  ORF Transcript_71646/g.198802 Transcript_71646/m.198802 type:complete len:213 (+) Transcript_71646:585-1223(+)
MLGDHHSSHCTDSDDTRCEDARTHFRPSAPARTAAIARRLNRGFRRRSAAIGSRLCGLDIFQFGHGHEHFLAWLRAWRDVNGKQHALIVWMGHLYDLRHLAATWHLDGHRAAWRDDSCGRLLPTIWRADLTLLTAREVNLDQIFEIVLVRLAAETVLAVREASLKGLFQNFVLILPVIPPMTAQLHLEFTSHCGTRARRWDLETNSYDPNLH